LEAVKKVAKLQKLALLIMHGLGMQTVF